jgi:hypothetical protein
VYYLANHLEKFTKWLGESWYGSPNRLFIIMKCPKCKDTGVVVFTNLPDSEFSCWCGCEIGENKFRKVASIISPRRQPLAAKGSKS